MTVAATLLSGCASQSANGGPTPSGHPTSSAPPVIVSAAPVPTIAATQGSSSQRPTPTPTVTPSLAQESTPPGSAPVSSPITSAQPGDGPSASLIVSGGLALTLVLPRVSCNQEVEPDGSSGITLLFRLPGQPAWDFLVGASATKGHSFDHKVTIATDSNSITDPYSGVANFLDSNGSTGSGWTVGGAHGVLLPGTITINGDLSGSIDAPMRGSQPNDKLSDIRVVGHWTC